MKSNTAEEHHSEWLERLFSSIL